MSNKINNWWKPTCYCFIQWLEVLSLIGDAYTCLMSIVPRLRSIHEGKGLSWGYEERCQEWQAANMLGTNLIVLANRSLAMVDTKSRDQRDHNWGDGTQRTLSIIFEALLKKESHTYVTQGTEDIVLTRQWKKKETLEFSIL